MPKVTYLRTSKPDPYAPLKVLLAGKRAMLGLTNAAVGKAVGQTHPTVAARLKDPENMTIGELQRYARALHITREEIFAALPQW